MEDEKLKELILNNQDLIYSIIHKFRSRDVEDLFQAGCIGLIKAYQNFNPKINVKFTSYAYNYIVGEVYQFMINNHCIHMSPMNMKLLSAINKTEEYLTNHLSRSPTIDEVCSFLEIDRYKYSEIKNALVQENLDCCDQNLISVEKLSKDDLIDLKNALNGLSITEKRLIKERYFNNFTQSELANIYNTNQVSISREEKKILSKLKAKMY